MAYLLPLGLVGVLLGAVVGCSSESPANPGPGSVNDGAVDSAIAEPDSGIEEAGPTCATAACTNPGDCVAPLQGVAGCWRCVAGCCKGSAKGSDTMGACAAKATACTTSSCDGNGACTAPVEKPENAPCGMVCAGPTSQAIGLCSAGKCEYSSGNFCSGATPVCAGAAAGCGLCPASGCKAGCAATGSPTCP